MQVEELLRQLTGPAYLELDDHSRHQEWQRLRELARQRFSQHDLAALAAADRVRGQLLLAGQPEAFRRFALAELAIRATTRCTWANWRSGGLEVAVTGVLDRPGDPLFELSGTRVLLRVPPTSEPSGPDPRPDVTSEATAGLVALVLHEEGNESTIQETILVSGPGALTFDESHTRLGFEVRLTIDPDQLPSGRWHSYLRIASCGWTVHAPLDLAQACPPVAVLPDRRFAAPVRRPLGLVVSETLPPAALPVSRGTAGSTDVRVTRTGTQLRIGLDLALHAVADATGVRIPLRLTPERLPGTSCREDDADHQAVEVDARLVCGSGGIGMLEAIVPIRQLAAPGRYSFRVDGARLGVDLVLDADGRARALAPPVLSVVGATDREFGEDLEWVPRLSGARGEYVVFGLPDAEVSDQTLTRLAHYGRQHEAEIVLVRDAESTDRYDRPRTNLGADPSLLGHGVPGTLYSRRLLERVGLDASVDHPLVFDALAHVNAESTAVLGAATDQLDPRELVRLPSRGPHGGPQWRVPLAELESAFTALLDRAEAGSRRDTVLLRWLDEQLVARIRAEALLALAADRRTALISAVRRLIDRYCPDQTAALAPIPRMAAALATHACHTNPDGTRAELPEPETGTGPDALLAFAGWERDLSVVEDRTVQLGWQDASTLGIATGFRLDGASTLATNPPVMLLGETGATHPLTQLRARLLLCDDHGTARFAVEAGVRLRTGPPPTYAGSGTQPVPTDASVPDRLESAADHRQPPRTGPVVPSFDVWASADLGSVAGRTLPPGVWQLRFRIDCLGAIRNLDPTARSSDLPGGERRSQPSAHFPQQYLALAVGVEVDGSVELLRIPAPYVRAKSPLRRLLRKFSIQRTRTRRNS